MACLNGSFSQFKMNVSKLMEMTLAKDFVYEGKKAAIPLVALDVWKLLTAEERASYCEALVSEVFIPSRMTPASSLDDIDFEISDGFVDVLLDVPVARATSVKQKKQRAFIKDSSLKRHPSTNTWYLNYAAWNYRPRNLIVRLREIITNKRTKADVTVHMSRKPNCIYRDTVIALPEMDSNDGPAEQTIETSNVVLGQTQVESVDVADRLKPATWYELSSTEENPDYANLTDRFTFWKSLQWNEGSSASLLSTSLPFDFINSYPRTKMPMFIPFHIHQYFRGDMEIKIQINSNKFQAGQLICFWYYGSAWEDADRTHIANAVQLPHVLISAGASNEATLIIPFRYHVAYMHTKQRLGYPDPLHLGSLVILPLVPLSTSAGGSKYCMTSVFIRFKNSSFTGLVDGSVNPEMDLLGTVVKEALPAIGSILNAPNCDNPPSAKPPEYLVPTASHSWSIGNSIVEPIHRLSLQNNLGLKHTSDTVAEDLHYTNIINKFGLLKIISWNSSDASLNKTGSLLWSCNVHPQMDKRLVYTNFNTKQLDAYYVPPCGVISSLFEYWRGSLEFKFDIVATSFHTGRLLIAYIPGISANTTITLEQARNSAHIVFSLQDSSSFTFKVPYISDRPWWKRKYGGPQRRSESLSPSALFMFVLNPLIPMESVAKDIKIVPYVRAGSDFELAVPVQPAIGLSYNTNNIVPGQVTVTFKSGYYPVYVGNWHSFFDSTKCILRYGSVSDHIAQLDSNPKPASLAFVWSPSDKGLVFKYTDYGSAVKTGKMTYGVILNADGYFYMIPYDADHKEMAIKAAWSYKLGKPISEISPYILGYVEDGVYTSGNVVWTATEYPNPFTETDSDNEIDKYAYPEMERENAPNLMSPTATLKTTGSGAITFGENFSDLKDLLRRYQLYWDGSVTAPSNAVRDYALLQLPICPTGLALSITNSRPMWNSAREGHIPIIGSAYRYYRGGLRFRIVVSNYQGMIWIQYRSDRPLNQGRVAKTGKDILAADRYRNHSYPFYVQDMSINRIIECEVPYYQPGIFGINGKLKEQYYETDLSNFTSMGDLVIGVEGSVIPNDMQIAVYYSVADDFSYNTYVGFPAVVYADETAFPEMEFVSGCVSSVAGSLFGKVISTPIRQNVKEAKRVLVSEIVQEAQSKIEPLFKQLQTEGSAGLNEIKESMKDGFLKQTLVNSIGQLMQVMINPTPASLAIALCSLIGSLLAVSLELVLKLQDLFTKFISSMWTKYFAHTNDLQAVESSADPELDAGERDYNTSVFTLIFGLVCTTIGTSARMPKDWPSFTKGMKEDLGLTNNATLFFKNAMESIIYCYEYLIGETDDIARARRIISREYPSLEAWVNEVLELLDPRRKRKISKSSREANRVFDACHYGALIIKANLDKSCPSGRLIFDLYSKICKLRDDLVEGGNHPNVRFEPFSIYMVGNEGVGKSFITSRVCKELLKSIDYRSSEEMIFWLQLGQKYWNGIGNPPVIARDEAYAIDGQFTDEEIQVHMAMCSSSVFNPPMAAVEEKNKRINPLIYYMNSNVEFPTFINARCPKAIYRRRKILARARFSDDILSRFPDITDASQLPAKELENFAHLRFDICKNPKDASSDWTLNLSYQDFLLEATHRFKTHYESETVNFRQRMIDNYCLDPDFDEDDNMEFIKEIASCQVTLKERMERDRARCEEILDDAELENDSYLKTMLEKARNLYSRVFPEIGEEASTSTDRRNLNETQCGFYSNERREQIKILMAAAKLDKAVAQKLLSGTDIESLSEDDVAHFCILEDFKPIIEDPARKYTYWIGTHDCSLLSFGAQTWNASEIGHDDARFVGRWSKSLLPNWKDRSGIDSLRSYVYWLIRQAQWLDIMSSCNLDNEIVKINILYQDFLAAHNIGNISIEDLNSDNAYTHDETLRKYKRLYILLNYLKKCGFSRKVCDHSKVWCENMHDLNNLNFNSRFKLISYSDSIGLTYNCSVECECGNHFSKLFSNRLFKRALKILWANDHKQRSDEIQNPFRMTEHEQLVADSRSFLTRCKEWCADWWNAYASPMISTILRFIRDHVFSILGCLLGVFAIYHIGKNASSCYSTTRNTDFSFTESNYYNDHGVPRRGAAKAAPAKREFVNVDINIEKKILDNACFIKCTYPSGDGYREIKGRCLGIRNHQVLVIRHYFEEFERFKDIAIFQLILFKSGKESVVNLSWDDFSKIRWLKIGNADNSSNFGVLDLPPYIPMFRNIVNYLPTQNMHKNVRSEADFLSAQGASKRGIRIEQQDYLRIAGIDEISELELDVVYRYGHHGAGLCGSVLVDATINNGNPGVFAMHVAGRNGIGYAEPICREWFEACPPRVKGEYVLPVLRDVSESHIPLEGNMIFYGCVDEKFVHRESGKSRIIPSLLHGQVYPVLTEPNPLRPNDPRQPPGSHPLRDGCNKHGSGYPLKFNSDFLHLVDIDARQELVNKCRPVLSSVEPFSYQDAICGNVSIPFCDALKWTSSEGFPLSVYRPKGESGKKWLFDLTETPNGLVLEGMNEKLESLLRVRERMREEDKVLPSIYVDCLKDYRLTPEKCAIPGKTRIFSIAPVQTTIDIRRYLGNFLCSYKSGCIYAEHGIGINPDSLQWSDLANYLLHIGPNIVTGDYANFGPTLSSQIVRSCLDNILYWHKFYGASASHLHHLEHLFYYEILTPLHLCGDLVYQPLNGIGSGSPITAELNSEVNKHYIKYAWLDIMYEKNKELAPLDNFHKHVRVVTYGDDFIMSVSDKVKHLFNCKTISDCLRKYGIKLTSADKGEEITALGTLENSSFLKRTFKKHPTRAGVWLAPIEKKSIMECINWCHKSEDIKEATSEVVRASLDLAFGHGPEFYEEHRDKINQALILHEIPADLKDWRTRDFEIFG